jgi:CheY-like chemotaxis protein
MNHPSYLTVAPTLSGGQLLDLVLDVESRLRNFIRRVLSRVQSDWESLLPRSIRDELMDLLAKKATHWKGWRQPDMLDCATLGQLMGVLGARWKDFASSLPNKAKVTTKLDECREYRNRLAHADPLSDDDKIRVYMLVQDLTEMIPDTQLTRAFLTEKATRPLGLNAKRIIWVDDHPEWTRMERRWFEELGADVAPVFSNEDAVVESRTLDPDLVISDIARDKGEDGTQLAARMAAAGMHPPILFYVSDVDRNRPLPAGAVGITNDPAELVRDALQVLRPPHLSPPWTGASM